jgi:hypothetical protein
MKPRQSGHRYIEIINRYYEGCNTGNVELMMSTFTSNVVHYFVDHSAVKGSSELANYWAKVGPITKANWVLDHAIVQEPEAVIEWSMQWTPPKTGEPELLRGSEWYYFANNRIAEIRSYHNNYYLQSLANKELWEFDYEDRGYRTNSTRTETTRPN